MIAELRVQNLLLIERAELSLLDGLNVLTGETGAGKTVLAHALDLLLGGKPRSGIVRPGASEAYVEGTFRVPAETLDELPEGCAIEVLGGEEADDDDAPSKVAGDAQAQSKAAGDAQAQSKAAGDAQAPSKAAGDAQAQSKPANDAEAMAGGKEAVTTVEVVLGRRVGADGRTRAYLNGRTATVGDLREIGSRMISFYGQHEHRKLTLAAAQLDILDRFCGPQQQERRAACAVALVEARDAEAEVRRLAELQGARERELDLLEYEIEEIDRFAPEPREPERLISERELLRRLDGLRAAAAAALEALDGDEQQMLGGARLVADAAARLQSQSGVDERLDALGQRCETLAIELQDLCGELRGYDEQLDGQDGALETLEERLAGLERLMRKHGGDVDAVLAYAESSRARRDELLGAEVAAEEAKRRLAAALERLDRHVGELRAAREQAAPRLSAAVREQLAALAMPDARFEVRLSPREPTSKGADAVELMIAPNPGVDAGPLREIASGGELSRTMLALIAAADAGIDSEPARRRDRKQASRPRHDPAPVTLVFDEIDAGIGGQTARAVGERLRGLAEHRQVLCITHLPQVASLAHRHFAIAKDSSTDPARTDVVQLDERELVGEIVRMLGAAEGDSAARKHASELLKAA